MSACPVGITATHVLRNGLRVLICEVPTAPIVSCWLWHRVGSRYDPAGFSGLSHFVEHLLFRESPQRSRSSFKHLLARCGGTSNGFTALDYSAIFATLPADRVTSALSLLAERLLPPRFDSEVVERERAIIQAERERVANAPAWWLTEAVLATAFQRHPYQYRVLGTAQDLAAIHSAALDQHSRSYYTPNNSVLVIVGAVAVDSVLPCIEHSFADLPGGPMPAVPSVVEPRQEDERRVALARPAAFHELQIVYHAPVSRHPDFAALLVLDAVLSGAKAVSFSRGASTQHSARLTRALVAPGWVLQARSRYCATHDPWLFELTATIPVEVDPSEIEAAVLEEIARIQQDGVTPMEVCRARKQIFAQWAYARESVTRRAWWVGMWEMLGDPMRGEMLLDELQTVTAADAQRVAQMYLTACNRTVGHLQAGAFSKAQGYRSTSQHD
jgi:zinc protease